MVARLQHPTLGFNAWVDQLADAYGLDPEDWHIDFEEESRQFFIDVEPEDVESEDLSYPNASLMFQQAVNEDQQQGGAGQFSGTVLAQLTIEISTEQEKLPRTASKSAHLIDAVMFACFTNRDMSKFWRPGGNVVFTRELRSRRGDWRPGGLNWIRTLTYSFPFIVEA